MRNWNRQRMCGRTGASMGFQTTYEELKLVIDAESNLVTVASRLPMRNWNVASWLNQPVRKHRFQTTYEELKREFADRWDIKPFCFQTTYEELKPVACNCWYRDIRLPDYLWGIETVSKMFYFRDGRMLPDYLWGIETCCARCNIAFQRELPDYLWGIETSLEPSSLWVCDCFQTTYEELKPSWQKNDELRNCASRLPMRNWNPNRPRGHYAPSSASRLPMRNWNLYIVFILAVFRLPDYLWGIETD